MYDLYSFKVAIIGDSLAGKTSIIKTFTSSGTQFSRSYLMTSDVSLNSRDILMNDDKDAVELIMYDSSGNSLYSDYLRKFWVGIKAIIAVFDITSENSFESVSKWVEISRTIDNSLESSSDDILPIGVLFGNKLDLMSRRKVTSVRAETLASQLGLTYFEGSAKSNIMVEEAFTYLGSELHKLSVESEA